MTRVNTGIQFEYKVRDYLRAKGYQVMRAAGSKGAIDLLAWKEETVLAIQCKKETRKQNYSSDWERLCAVSMPVAWKRQVLVKRGNTVYIQSENGQEQELSIKEINKVIKEFNNDND